MLSFDFSDLSFETILGLFARYLPNLCGVVEVVTFKQVLQLVELGLRSEVVFLPVQEESMHPQIRRGGMGDYRFASIGQICRELIPLHMLEVKVFPVRKALLV